MQAGRKVQQKIGQLRDSCLWVSADVSNRELVASAHPAPPGFLHRDEFSPPGVLVRPSSLDLAYLLRFSGAGCRGGRAGVGAEERVAGMVWATVGLVGLTSGPP